jgi:ankyrin repeat protein
MAAQLLEAGADVNAALPSGRTPLHLAILGQHSSIVELLLEAGACYSCSSRSDGTPLALAVSSGQTALVGRLLEAGDDVTASSGISPSSLLLLAISKGHAQIAEQLLAAGASVEEIDDGQHQRTALHLAAERGYTHLIGLLVEQGADIDLEDTQGATPLDAALAHGHNQTAIQLIALGTILDVPNGTTSALHVATKAGSVEVVTALLAAGASAIQLDPDNNTPLHLAAAAGHAAVVGLLLAAPDMHPDMAAITTLHTALHAAAEAGQAEVCQQLVEAGADVHAFDISTGLTALGYAVTHQRLSTVRALLAAGTDPNVRRTLQTAVSMGVSDELCVLLVEAGANIDATIENGETVLHLAVRKGRYGTVQLLLRLGASSSIASDRSGTPLHLAVALGEHFIVQQLAAAGANLAATRSSMGFATPCTPLYMAIQRDDVEMVEVLLAAGADASQGTSKGYTPLHAALQAGQWQLAERLIAAGADTNAVTEEAGTPLTVAMRKGNDAMVSRLLAAGADPTLGTSRVLAPLMAAVRYHSAERVSTLLAAPALRGVKEAATPGQAPAAAAAAVPATGVSAAAAPAAGAAQPAGAAAAGEAEAAAMLNPEGTCISTSSSIRARMGAALVAAVAGNKVPVVSLLLEAGACPNTLDPSHGAPLHLAVAASDAVLVAQLLEAGADVNLVCSKHGTALGIAVRNQDSTLAGLLLGAGALPDQLCSGGNTPLNVAAGSGQVAIAEQLLDAGAAVNLAGKHGLAPLHTAIAYGDKQMVELLLGRGAALDVSSKGYGTPLQAAVYVAVESGGSQQSLEVVQVLLAAGADPKVASHGSTAGGSLLHAAVEGRCVQLVQMLIAAGAEVNAASSEGTPLQLAVGKKAEEVVRMLLSAGANPNLCSTVTDEDGDSKQVSPLGEALNKECHTIAAALLFWGADPNGSSSSGCRTLLHAAVARRDMAAVELLLAAKANPNSICTQDGSTPLMDAVCQGSEGIAERLLAAGAQPNVVCSSRQSTPLQDAILLGWLNLALKLLAAGADPNLGQNFKGGTALQLAISRGDALVGGAGSPYVQQGFNTAPDLGEAIPQGRAVVKALLAAGAQPDATGGVSFVRPLQLAVRHEFWQDVAGLLAAGADASVVDSSSGNTLLHTAVCGGTSQMVKLLVSSSASVNAKNRAGDTPLLMLAQRISDWTWGIMKQLLQHPDIDCNILDAKGCPALHYAVLSNSSSGSTAMAQLLTRGADPSVKDGKGRTPLHLAAVKGYLGAAQQLVAAGADVRATAGSMGWTPLMMAIAAGHQDVVRCLLAGGAGGSVSASLADGTTALHLACGRPGTEQMVADLLAAGAAPGAADSSGNTPLHLAAATGCAGIVGRLLAAGAPASCLNSNRELPLHLAIAGGHTAAAVQLIAAAKASDEQCINAVTAAGAAPIHLAAVTNIGILKKLLGCSALQVDLVDGAGQTGLHLTAAGGFHRSIRLLVTAGADKDALDAGGATPLHRLPLTSDTSLVALLATPSNINRVVGGTTLLHTAAAGPTSALLAAVIAAGASTGTQDSQGECALVTAARQGTPWNLSLLLRHTLWQHKQQQVADDVSLPSAVVTAVQVVLAGRPQIKSQSISQSISQSMMTVVMKVLGQDAASTLWQQLLQQHHSSFAQQGDTPDLQPPPLQQQQQQPAQALKPEQLRRRLGDRMLTVAVQGFLQACADVAQQRKEVSQPLDQAIGSTMRSSAGSAPSGGRQQAAVGGSPAAMSAGVATQHAAQHKVVTLEHTTEAARLGQRLEVLHLLQQLPQGVRVEALGAAAQAAAGAGHYQLCVQLLQQLAVLDCDEAKKVFVQLGLKTGDGDGPPVKVLGPRSLALCGALLAGWQALRRQQQQELVDSVVSAVVVWKEEQQQVVVQTAGRKRLCPPGHRHVAKRAQQQGDGPAG